MGNGRAVSVGPKSGRPSAEERIPLRVAGGIVSRHSERITCHAERSEASRFGDETLRCAQGDTVRSE